MKKIFKAAIVGFGYMGEIRRRVVESSPYLELAGICDTSPEIRAKIKGCRVFESFGQLLEEDLDIVFVCTPNSYSPEICLKSLKLGKHVFCEKPPGRNLEDAKMIAQARSAGNKLMFGFNHRFHPAVIKAKLIVDSGKLGSVIALRGTYGKSGGRNFHKSWRNDKSVSGGGILLDQGIHMLDLFCYFCGDFRDIKCFTANKFWKFDIEDNAYVMLKNDKDQLAFLHSSATLWRHTFKLQIILEQGYLTVEGLLSKSGSYGREKLILGKRQFEDEAAAFGNPAEEITYFDRDLSWDLEVEEFLRCIIEDSPVAVSSSADAIRVMEIIEKAYQDSKPDKTKGAL